MHKNKNVLTPFWTMGHNQGEIYWEEFCGNFFVFIRGIDARDGLHGKLVYFLSIDLTPETAEAILQM